MIKLNEYFQGKVKSLTLQAEGGPATVGVIAAGEYEFGTSSKEIMKVVSGLLAVQLPETTGWKDYSSGESFVVETGKKFKVKAAAEVAYLCLYR